MLKGGTTEYTEEIRIHGKKPETTLSSIKVLTQNLILGLDIGTSSVRAALYDENGRMLPDTFVKSERDLNAEIDADVALDQLVAVVDRVLNAADACEITHVASCAFWHSLMGVDASGRPTTKVLSWADTQSREYTDVLRKSLSESEIHNRTGARFHSSFWPAKLLWLRNKNEKVFAETEKWISLSDYFSMRLTERDDMTPATSISMASATGLFRIRECRWDEELLDFLGLHESNFAVIAENLRRLNREFAKRWPQLKNAWWSPTIGDGAANNIGANCVTSSRAALMIGTSGAMRIAYRGKPHDKIPNGLWCYRIDRERVIVGGALSDGGGLYQQLKEEFRLDDSTVEIEIAKRKPASHDITVMPFFFGERSTGYHENAEGAIIGANADTDPIDIVHAAFEAVAYRLAEIFDQLNDICAIEDIVASGGALHASPVWTQIIADVLGRDLTLPNTDEASMRGAVLLALETTGRIKKIEDLPTPTGKKFKADKRRTKLYAAARKRHQGTYGLLIDQERS